jgi:ATP-binding cassette, subfamily B, bacterial
MGLGFIQTVLRHFMKYRLMFILFVLCILIEVAYAVAAPLSLKYLVDGAFTPRNVHVFILIMGLLLAGGLMNIVANIYGDYSLGKLSGETIKHFRTELFTHLQKQSLSFYQRFQVGDLVTRFVSDMGTMERVIRASFPFSIRETLSVLLGVFLLFSIEWKLTLVMLAGSSLMFIGPKLLQGRTESANAGYKQAQEQFSNLIDETVKGHRTIKGLYQQGKFQEQARRQIQQLFSFGFQLHMTNSLLERLPLTALLILNGMMMGFGGYLIFQDELTIGGFMAFFTLFLGVGQSVSNLSFLIPQLIDSKISFQRVGEILKQEPEVPEAKEPIELPAALHAIGMERVSFGYSKETLQLRSVSLQIPAGSYVAFVGPSGSGKSTALQLLSRFYDPSQGTVSINGYDLRKVSEASLRRLAALVAQDTFLFQATIRDNLLLDSEELTEEDMIEAAKQANIHHVIAKWPDQYDTWVHQGGTTLSGGERQRISIARALLRRSPLVLLDEVTSALDPAAEAEINQLIQQLRQHRTIVSVTHRLDSVVSADKIYVFQEGSIVEAGTHGELLQRGGLYRSLWDKQHGFQLSSDGLYATVDAERLAKLPFFEGIEQSVLGDLASLFATETCHEGESIVLQGEEGNKFFIIVRGKFEVLKQGQGEDRQRIAVLQDGDHFGEIALLRNIPRTATVQALAPSILLSIRREAFLQIIQEHPHILARLEQALQHRM